jgi:hypothetical protein
VRKWIGGALLASLGVSVALPAAALAYPCGGYRRPCYRPCRPWPGRRVVVQNNNGSGWPGLLVGAAVGAGLGYAIDHRVWEDRDRDRDCDDRSCDDGDQGKWRDSKPSVQEKAPPAPAPEQAPAPQDRGPAPAGPDGSLGLADRPVRVGDFRVEALIGQRIKIAWLGDDRELRGVELFTAGSDRNVLQRERVAEFPFAATFDAPERDGFLGVTLIYRSGETVTRMLPVTELGTAARRPVRDATGT